MATQKQKEAQALARFTVWNAKRDPAVAAAEKAFVESLTDQQLAQLHQIINTSIDKLIEQFGKPSDDLVMQCTSIGIAHYMQALGKV